MAVPPAEIGDVTETIATVSPAGAVAAGPDVAGCCVVGAGVLSGFAVAEGLGELVAFGVSAGFGVFVAFTVFSAVADARGVVSRRDDGVRADLDASLQDANSRRKDRSIGIPSLVRMEAASRGEAELTGYRHPDVDRMEVSDRG